MTAQMQLTPPTGQLSSIQWKWRTTLLLIAKITFSMLMHGSPYTVPPLSTLLNYNSLTPFGRKILDGTAGI